MLSSRTLFERLLAMGENAPGCPTCESEHVMRRILMFAASTSSGGFRSSAPSGGGCAMPAAAACVAVTDLGDVVDIRTATLEDLAVIVDTAARSLDAEAMLRWSFGEERFEERIRRHFAHYDGEKRGEAGSDSPPTERGSRCGPPDAREEHEAIGPAPPGAENEILGDHADHHAAFWGWIEEHQPEEPLSYLSHSVWHPSDKAKASGAR